MTLDLDLDTTDDDLKHLQELCDRATPGPWEDGTAMCCPDMGWVDGPKGKGIVCPVFEASKNTHTLDANDAEFIAAARTALPALIAEVRRLRAAAPVPDDPVCAHGAQWGGISVGVCDVCDGLALEAATGKTVKA